MQHTTEVALLVAYFMAGMMCWGHLISFAETDEERELVIGAGGACFWYVVGKWMLIAVWPTWTVAPSVYKSMRGE